jgi:hypothetical protein
LAEIDDSFVQKTFPTFFEKRPTRNLLVGECFNTVYAKSKKVGVGGVKGDEK